jgi:cell division protein FtsB
MWYVVLFIFIFAIICLLFFKGAAFWGALAVIIVGALILIATRIWRWKMESEEIDRRVRVRLSKSPQQLEAEIASIRRKKRELEHRMDILSKAKPRVTVFPKDDYDFDSIESQIANIRRQLEYLDHQEDDLEEDLNYKKSCNG